MIGKENKKIKPHRAACLSGLCGLSEAHGSKAPQATLSQRFLFSLTISQELISTEGRGSHDHFLVMTHLPLKGSVKLQN